MVIKDKVREQFLSKMLNFPGQPFLSPVLCSVLIGCGPGGSGRETVVWVTVRALESGTEVS